MCLQPRGLPLQSHTCCKATSPHHTLDTDVQNLTSAILVCCPLFVHTYSSPQNHKKVCSSLWSIVMFSLIKQNILCIELLHCHVCTLYNVDLSHIFELHIGSSYISAHHTSAHTCFITPDTLTQLNQTYTFAMQLNFITIYIYSRSLHCNVDTNFAKRSKFQKKSLW